MINLLGNWRRERLSSYNVLAESEDGTILYNQVSGAMILLTLPETAMYEKVRCGNLRVDCAFLDVLRHGGYLLSSSFDEIGEMQKMAVGFSESTDFKSMTIAPTDRCNLDCPYCFEAKDQWVLMSEEVQGQVKDFALKFITETPTRGFSVTWYGGEPTLHMGCIENLSGYFAAICEEKNIQFTQSMITNGTTLNAAMRKRLKDIGVMILQITVDGLKEDHDKKRPYRVKLPLLVESSTKSGCGSCGSSTDEHAKSSFDSIMQYLPDLREDGFNVSIRVNLNLDNMESFQPLAKQLYPLSAPSKSGGRVTVYPARIFEFRDQVSMEEFGLLDRKTRPLNPFSGKSCMASQRYGLGISQNGKIVKCWHQITNENHVVGTVTDEAMRKGYFDGYSPVHDPECRQCAVLPTCWGSCRQQNEFWEKGYAGDKYAGCDDARWDIAERVKLLYKRSRKNEAVGSKAT
jgi:uncharacterized protein